MKKTCAVILSLIVFITSMNLNVFALEQTDEFNLDQYSIEDIAQMSAVEFRALLADFERVYDPFGTYETNAVLSENTVNSNGISPRWTSGDDDGSETGSHELITARACVILTSDMGFFGETDSEQLLIALSISLASLLPDRDFSSISTAFVGHFYNPYTQASYNGSTSNTARSNAYSHFSSAITAYEAGDTAEMCEQLGRSLHYIQDVCQPMHASDFTELSIPVGAHGDFEGYVDGRIDNYLDNITSVNTYDFDGKGNYSYVAFTPNYYVRQAAFIAYEYRGLTNINDSPYYSNWNAAANVAVQNAVAFSALLMYSFAGFANISLT